MITPVKQAKAMFSNMPEDVFNGFLAPLIGSYGWPFRSVYQILDGTEWFRILFPLTLPELHEFRWHRKRFSINNNTLYEGSVVDLKLIIRNKEEDVWAALNRDSTPCRNSLLWHETHIKETRKLFAPVTIAFTPWGYKILDGSHRIAALFDLGLNDTAPVDAWVGS